MQWYNTKSGIQYLASLIVCLIYATSAISGTNVGLEIDRWKCFKPKYYKCVEYADMDAVLERLTSWDTDFRKDAITYSGYEDGGDCNNNLYLISYSVLFDEIEVKEKKAIVSNISEFLLHNESNAQFTDGSLSNLLVANALSLLDGVYLGSWADFASHSQNNLAQCIKATDRLKKIFSIKDREDVSWRNVRNLQHLYTADVLNQKAKHPSKHVRLIDVEIGLYWLKQASETNEYANMVWNEIGHLYQGFFD